MAWADVCRNDVMTIRGGALLFAVNDLLHFVSGSFHVKSTDFWPFFHGPPPILLKFGTLVGIV